MSDFRHENQPDGDSIYKMTIKNMDKEVQPPTVLNINEQLSPQTPTT